jgi:O-antigen ligase
MTHFPFNLNSFYQWFEPKSELIKRILFSILVVVVTSGIGVVLPQRYKILLLALIVGLFGIIVLYRKPQLGVAFLVAASLTVPLKIGTGTGTDLNAAILLVAALFASWMIKFLMSPKGVGFFYSRPLLPLFIFLIIVVFAFGFGQIRWFPGASPAPIRAQIGATAIFFLSALAFLIPSNLVEEPRWLKIMVFTFLGIGALYIFLRLIPDLGIIEKLFPSGADGSLFWVWLVALAFSQAVFNHSLAVKWRAALIGLVVGVLFIAMILNRGWTSGWLPALVGLAVIAWFGLPKRFKVIGIILGGCLLLALPALSSFVMVGDNEYSMVTRVEAWKILGEIIKVNPLFGVGPANYYWYTRLFPIMGYFSLSFNSHNNYVDLIAQTGILGLGAFLWFSVELVRLTWSLFSRLPGGFERAFILGALGGLVGTLVAGMFGDWIIPFVYNIGYAGFRSSVLAWLFLGGILVVEKNLAKKTLVK